MKLRYVFDCAVQLDVTPSAEGTVDGNLICRVSFLSVRLFVYLLCLYKRVKNLYKKKKT